MFLPHAKEHTTKLHNMMLPTIRFDVPIDWPCLHTLIATGHEQIRVPD